MLSPRDLFKDNSELFLRGLPGEVSPKELFIYYNELSPKRLRIVELTVGFNPISKAAKRVSATPAVLLVHMIS